MITLILLSLQPSRGAVNFILAQLYIGVNKGRQVTANTAEHRHSLFGAEAPGDLLLHFDHAQISLGLVVVKRHGKIEQEAQHGPFALREPIQQIARRTLFRSPRFSLPLFRLLGWWRWRIGEVRSEEHTSELQSLRH